MEDQTSRELVFCVSWRHYWHGQKDYDTNTTKEGSIIIPRHGGDRQQNECKSIGIATVDAEQEHTRSLPTMTGSITEYIVSVDGSCFGEVFRATAYLLIGLSCTPSISEAKIKVPNGPRHERESRRWTIIQP